MTLVLDTVRLIAAYAPLTFVCVSRGPCGDQSWVDAPVLRGAFVAWGRTVFTALIRKRIADLCAYHGVSSSAHARRLMYNHVHWTAPPPHGTAAVHVNPQYTNLEWSRAWFEGVARLLPREHAVDRWMLGRLARACTGEMATTGH